jgi:hypothetical protein
MINEQIIKTIPRKNNFGLIIDVAEALVRQAPTANVTKKNVSQSD